MTRRMLFTIVTCLATVTGSTHAQNTWHVDVVNCSGTGDGSAGNPFCLIQKGVDAAGDGDTVVIHPGNYFESVTVDVDTIPRSLTIRSTAPTDPDVMAATVLHGLAGLNTFGVTGGPLGPHTVTFEGLTLRDPYYGIFAQNVRCVVNHCAFMGAPAAGDTQAIWMSSSLGGIPADLTVRHSTFVKLRTTVNGAAIHFGGGTNGTCEVEDSSFIANHADDVGGAISGLGFTAGGLPGNTAKIRRCTFRANSVGSEGGAIFWSGPDLLLIEDCAFSGNRADGSGGAVFLRDPVNSGMITRSTFEGNVTGLLGGAIFLQDAQPNTLITENRFDGNCAVQGGGGIEFDLSGALYLDNRFCHNLPLDVAGTYTDGGGNLFDYCAQSGPAPDPCPADLNNDGVVNVLDLLQMLTAWGAC